MTTSLLSVRAAALLVAVCVPAATCEAQVPPDNATAQFKSLDANHDGVISKYEYDSDAAFQVMDTNHNNRVSESELQHVLGTQEDGTPSAAQRLAVADINGDKELSDEELRRALEFRFNWLDSDKDGNLDLGELKAGFGEQAPR